MQTITAHGATYTTAAAANARIAELNEENLALGASDGRVTEILLITEALQDAGWEASPAAAAAPAKVAARRPAAPALGPTMAAHVMEAEQRIAYLKRNRTADDAKWRYLKAQDDAGRITVRREYKTEAGFLAAFVRHARRGDDILIAE